MLGAWWPALVCCAVLVSVSGTALAEGKYQQTKDGKTLVWNQNPKPGDVATWTGDRDARGYATGFGTLSWYTGTQEKQTLYARYFGNMVRGKFQGPVNGHSQGVTAHAVFIEGRRTTPWAGGPVSSWRMPKASPELVEREITSAPAEGTPAKFNPPPPSYGAVSPQRPVPDFHSLSQQQATPAGQKDIPAEGPDIAGKADTNRASSNLAAGSGALLEIDDSLRSLIGPPSSLRTASSQNDALARLPNGHLLKQEVLNLADAEARKQGYDLDSYQRPDPKYDPADNTWSLFYDQKPGEGAVQKAKHFSVAVDDKTKRTAIVPAR